MAVIFLDAGHGGKDAGACGNNLKEKDVTLDVTKAVGERLASHGFTVKYSRTSDAFVGDASERGKKAGQSKADFALSIHVNSGGGKGAELLVPVSERVGAIEAVLVEEFKQLNTWRGIKSRDYTSGAFEVRTLSGTSLSKSKYVKDYYGFIRGAQAYGVSADIIELFFIDNASDVKTYQQNVDKYVEAIVKAICGGFKVAYCPPAVKLPETSQNASEGEKTMFQVVCGSYSEKPNAEKVKKQLEEAGFKGVFLQAVKR